MKIEEYFARLVAACLVPDWKNVWGKMEDDKTVTLRKQHLPSLIQLRKDGIDLYRLEWERPPKTEEYIDELGWVLLQDGIILVNLQMYHILNHKCLIADHGQICPTVKDFEGVYDDKIL